MQFNNFGSSEGILKQHQLETLKSLSMLLIREIHSLEETPMTLGKEIEADKAICLFEEVQRFEANMIRCALIRSMGKQTQAAKLLGMKVTTLNMKIRRYKIDLAELA